MQKLKAKDTHPKIFGIRKNIYYYFWYVEREFDVLKQIIKYR
jgi:hypothetical protein